MSESKEKAFQVQPIGEVGEIWTPPAAALVLFTRTTTQGAQTEKPGRDFEFDREGVCWQGMNLPVTWSFAGDKKAKFKCHGNKNTPSVYFILSLWTHAVLVWRILFIWTYNFWTENPQCWARTEKKKKEITVSSYYLVIWKIFDWGNKVPHWRAWVKSCRQKKQNQISVKPTFTPKTWASYLRSVKGILPTGFEPVEKK